MKSLNKYFCGLLLSVISLGGCSTSATTNIAPIASASAISTQSTGSNPAFELLIEQKKTNGELIPIGPKGVVNVSIDGYDYPVNKLIQEQLIIQIPNLVAGKHNLNVSLYSINDPFNVPLVIPNISQKVFVVLRLTINESKRQLSKIEYGYDLDRNGIIDDNAAKFESLDAQTFYAISTDGTRREIDTQISTSKAVPGEDAPPPGVVPQSGNTTRTDANQPQIQLPEPPKPKTNDLELYPLPPSASKLPEPPTPLPPEIEKKSVPQ